jgi:Type I phosphodiesterase / nucleotide pyrophosphatase
MLEGLLIVAEDDGASRFERWSKAAKRIAMADPRMRISMRLVRRLKSWLVLVALLLYVFTGSAQEGGRPIVVLISFDGWRWDYVTRTQVPNLQALALRGVRAEALVPSFPTKTFPNHYSIVTGLYPENHGIVSNVIADPDFPQRFTMSSPTARAPRWWGGEPIWVTAPA